MTTCAAALAVAVTLAAAVVLTLTAPAHAGTPTEYHQVRGTGCASAGGARDAQHNLYLLCGG